jgi:sec-independent protein translocase protein TatC
MSLLQKLFKLREQAHPGHEKPFIAHLEDFRKLITRLIVTLILAMVVCFTFQGKLMNLLRQPVEAVWDIQRAAQLPQDEGAAPRPVSTEVWEEAKAVELAAEGLDPERREILYRWLGDPELEFHARAAGLLNVLHGLPPETRDRYIGQLQVTDEMKRQLAALLVSQPNEVTDARRNFRMMSALKPTESFMLSMKLSFFAGIILSSPLLLLFILKFVLPVLDGKQKRMLWSALAIGLGLFLTGVSFAYFQVLPRALLFFYEWSARLGISNDWRIGEYIGFVIHSTLLFGLAFELPVVVMILVRLGMLDYATMAGTRAYAITAVFILAAILTPPDVVTQVLLAVPMILLYEICIWLAYFDARRTRKLELKSAREAG